jgi:DNA-binding transcriptional LysR family regulator
LTDAGRLFLTEARLALQQVERAAAIAGRAHRGETGELKIGFFGSIPFTLISQKILFMFRNAHPDVHLDLVEMPSFQQVDALVERQLVLGFVRPIPQLPVPLAARELFREPLMAVLRKDHRLVARDAPEEVALESLAADPFVLYPRAIGTGLYDQVLALCRDAGYTPRIGMEAGGTAAIIGLVAAGLGVSILPASLARIKMEDVVFRPLAIKATTGVWLAYRRDQRTPLCRAFIDLAVGMAGGKVPVIQHAEA